MLGKRPDGQLFGGKVPLQVNENDRKWFESYGARPDSITGWIGLKHKSCDTVVANKNGVMEITANAPISRSTFTEIPTLSLVQQTWADMNGWSNDPDILNEGRKRLYAKVKLYNNIPAGVCTFTEMGIRRAFTPAWHREVLTYLAANLRDLAGTSCVGAAKDLNLQCIGTMAHEYLEAGQVLSPDITQTKSFMLRAWLKRHGKRYAIALTDCLGLECFLREFDKELSNAFKGVRHDSGDPIWWGNKMLAHYENMGINPKTKIPVFSNALNPDEVFRILDAFAGKFQYISFGIGTDFCHDLGVLALSIVMKLIEFDGKPVAKISDDQGKGMCEDSEYETYLKKANGIL